MDMRHTITLTERYGTWSVYDTVQKLAAKVLSHSDDETGWRETLGAGLQKVADDLARPDHPLSVYTHGGFGALGKFVPDADGNGTILVDVIRLIDYKNEQEVDVERSADWIAMVFTHEFAHYLQHLKAWEHPASVSGAVKKAGIADSYLADSAEVHAHAIDVARNLVKAFGSKQGALNKLKTKEGLAKAVLVAPSLSSYARLRNLSGGQELFREFLRNVFLELSHYE